jgi:hypothetical protein
MMSEGAGAGYILRPGEGRPIDLGGFRMSVRPTEVLAESWPV